MSGFVPAARGAVTLSGNVCGGWVSSAAPAPPGWTWAPVASPCHAHQLQSGGQAPVSKNTYGHRIILKMDVEYRNTDELTALNS